MNFGTLKDIFTNTLIESHISNDKNGKKLYKDFLKCLKESETLKTAFIIFNNIENKKFNTEVESIEYIKECVSLFDKFRGEKALINESKKLTSLLDLYKIDYKSNETKDLHKSLQNLLTTNKNVSTIDKIHESKIKIASWLLSERVTPVENENIPVKLNVDPKKFLDIAVQKFNEKYKDSLNEEEKNILKILSENNEVKIKDLFNKLVKENISIVNDYLSDDTNDVVKSKLLETKDNIYKMLEDSNYQSNSIIKLYELKNNLKK